MCYPVKKILTCKINYNTHIPGMPEVVLQAKLHTVMHCEFNVTIIMHLSGFAGHYSNEKHLLKHYAPTCKTIFLYFRGRSDLEVGRENTQISTFVLEMLLIHSFYIFFRAAVGGEEVLYSPEVFVSISTFA